MDCPWPLTIATWNIHGAVGCDGRFDPTRIGAVLRSCESNVPADRIRAFAVVRVGADDCLEDVIEKPSDGQLAAFGDEVYLSMNCWRFDAAVLDACRRVPLSARGEYELPDAVRLAMHKMGRTFRVIRMNAGVLDLSSRGDIAAVKDRLASVKVSL